MNILITGIHGFVGTNLVDALKKEHTIYGLDIIAPQKDGIIKTFGWYELEQIPAVDIIVHLAGKAHDTKNTIDANKYFEINVGLTKQVYDYFLKSQAKKFIFFSSVKAVADSVHGEMLTEDYLPDPHTSYGKSKLEAEQYIISQYLPEDKKIYILRPCMIHGPGNKGNLNLLYKFIKIGFPYPLGAFDNRRSFTSINNLSFILKQLFNRDIAPGIYQVADDEALSTNEVITQIAKALGKKERILKIKQQYITRLAKLGDLLHLPFNSERLQKLTENYVVSNHKLMEAIRTQLPFSGKDGLILTLKSFNQDAHS
jgi:nucleoside-diphosphate-sugar epimerase